MTLLHLIMLTWFLATLTVLLWIRRDVKKVRRELSHQWIGEDGVIHNQYGHVIGIVGDEQFTGFLCERED
jgi:hypothetical protein